MISVLVSDAVSPIPVHAVPITVIVFSNPSGYRDTMSASSASSILHNVGMSVGGCQLVREVVDPTSNDTTHENFIVKPCASAQKPCTTLVVGWVGAQEGGVIYVYIIYCKLYITSSAKKTNIKQRHIGILRIVIGTPYVTCQTLFV